MYKVWCEWDMGFSNITDYDSIFDTKEEMLKALEKADWGMIGYDSWQDAEADGTLTIEEE